VLRAPIPAPLPAIEAPRQRPALRSLLAIAPGEYRLARAGMRLVSNCGANTGKPFGPPVM